MSQKDIDRLEFSTFSKKIIKAKRKGYYEFQGKFTGRSINNNQFTIEKFNNSSMPLILTLQSKDYFLFFEDAKRKINVLRKENNWKLESNTISFPYQSQLTSKIIEELITNGNCSLPTFESSIKNHILLIKSLKKEFDGTNLGYNDRVKIT